MKKFLKKVHSKLKTATIQTLNSIGNAIGQAKWGD